MGCLGILCYVHEARDDLCSRIAHSVLSACVFCRNQLGMASESSTVLRVPCVHIVWDMWRSEQQLCAPDVLSYEL